MCSDGTTAATYAYNPDGTLLSQVNGTAVTLYLPGEQITDDNGTITGIRYYTLPGGATAVRTGSGNAYNFEIPTDRHGTATLLLDYTAQNPTWRQFTPYGTPRGTTVTWPDNRTFLNDVTDPATTLTHIGARWYDSANGTFTSPDPLLQTSSPVQLNGYTYAGMNPVSSSDPTGLCLKSLGGPPINCGGKPVNGGSNGSGCIGLGCINGDGGGAGGIIFPGGGTGGTGNGIPAYVAGGYVIVNPSSSALKKAVRSAQNQISNGTGWYWPADRGFRVTSDNPVVKAAIAKAMCGSHPDWCVLKPPACTSFLCQANLILQSFVVAGAVSDGAMLNGAEEPGGLGLALNAGESQSYIDRTTGGSIRNVGTSATHTEFGDTLTNNGWIARTSKDGTVQIFTKDGAKYVLREKAGSYSGWSADFTPAGSPRVTLKIRLGV